MAAEVPKAFSGKTVFAHDFLWLDVVPEHKASDMADTTPSVILPPQLLSSVTTGGPQEPDTLEPYS
jgi:hypothetical protein